MAYGDDKRAAGFSVKQANRIARGIKRIESFYVADQRRSRAAPWNPGTLRAKCTTAIPTGTFDSPSSSGEVQLYARDQTGAWIESGDPVQCWNQLKLDADVAVDTACFVAWISGQWWLTQADCPAE